MKKIQKIIVEMIFIFLCLGMLQNVQATSLTVSSVTINMGDTADITIGIPNGFVAYEGTISYDTGKLSSTGNSGIIKVANADFNLEQVPNFSVSFTGISEGSANISVNLVLCKSDGTTENATGSGSINVIKNVDTTNNIQNTVENPQPAEPEMNFIEANETVYATQSMNVRSSWSKDSTKIGFLNKGQSVTRTGTASNGWSRIIYNGNVAYVASSLVTTENPEEIKEEPEPEELDQNSTEDTVQDTNTEQLPEQDNQVYQDIVSKIGTIPEVGKNYNIILFIVILLLSIISLIYIVKNNSKK